MNSALRRRDFLLRSAALAGASLLGPRSLAMAQEASPEAEPEEVTVGAPVEGKINVTWWSHNGPAFVDANTQMIEKFTAANPDVNIIYQYFPYDIFVSKLQAGYNSGTVSDMQQMFGTWVTQYAGFALLDPVPADIAASYEERFFPASIGAYKVNDQYFGMPKEFNLENGCMLVNPAILEEVGAPEVPATWQELVDTAVKATLHDDQNRVTRAGFQFTDSDTITFLFLANILQQGATYWADDGMHVNFQTDAARKAWTDQVELVTVHHVDDLTSYSGDRFLYFFQGNAAMSMRGPWVIPEGELEFPGLAFEYVNMPPYAGTENRFAAESGWGEVVNAASAPEVKEAAWRFINFMDQPENLREWAITTFTIPALVELQGDPDILAAAPAMEPAFNVLPYGQWIGPLQDRDRFFTILYDNFNAATLGELDADGSLLQAEQQINAMIDEMVGP